MAAEDTISEVYDTAEAAGQDAKQAVAEAVDESEWAVPVLGLLAASVGPGLAVGGASAAVQALGGLSGVSRRMHLASQMQAASEMLKQYPVVRERMRPIFNEIAEGERRQMDVLGDPRWAEYTQTYSAVPKAWMDALNARLDDRAVEIPKGTVGGKSYMDFENKTKELWAESAERANAAREKHGFDGIDPEMQPLHSSSTSTWGTGNILGRQVSELVSGVQNVWRELGEGGVAKGFEDRNREVLRADMEEAIQENAFYHDGKVVLPLSKYRYLSGESKFYTDEVSPKTKPVARVEGKYVVPLDKDGNPITTASGLEQWAKDEADRFSGNRGAFRNVKKDGASVHDPKDYKRQFPLLKNAHAATFHDVISELMGMDMESAALEAHSPDILEKLDLVYNSLGSEKTAQKIKNFVGGKNVADATTLVGRVLEQQGRMGESTNRFIRSLNAIAPFGYRYQLSMSTTPAAVQQAQAFSQTIAMMGGDKSYPLRHSKQYLKTLGNRFMDVMGSVGASVTGGRQPTSELGISHNKAAYDPITTEVMDVSTAMHNKAIEKNAAHVTGNMLRKGNRDWLETFYSDEDLDLLRSGLKEDGTVDMTDPRRRQLANSVLARYMESINGLDLPTSKPAAFSSPGFKPFTAFMGTPAVVTKASSDLYRPGGMFHTGNLVKDMESRAWFTAAMTAQLVGATAVRSFGALKALSLLSAGGLAPAVAQAIAYGQEHETQAEQRTQQELNMLLAATQRLANGEGDPDELAKDLFKVGAVFATGSVPMRFVGPSDVMGSFAGSVDKSALGYMDGNFGKATGPVGTMLSAAEFAPLLGAPMSMARRGYNFATRDYSPMGGPLDGKLEALFSRETSPLWLFRSLSPMVPPKVQYRKDGQQQEPGSGGADKHVLKPYIGGR